MHEGDIVDDEHARLAQAGEFIGDDLGRGDAVAAAIKRPGAAERAIPRTAAGELDRSTRVERANEVAPPSCEQVARRADRIQAFDEMWRRSFAGCADCAGHV